MKNTLSVITLGIIILLSACSKSKDSTPTVPTPTGGITANTFKLDDTITATTSSTVTPYVSTFTSVTYSVSFPGSGSDRVGLFFKEKPTASGTYKVRHTYPASNLAANEVFVDVNYGGCNYISYDTSQTVTITMSGTNVNVQFNNLNYSFNNWVVSGFPTPRSDGHFSGNLNYQNQ